MSKFTKAPIVKRSKTSMGTKPLNQTEKQQVSTIVKKAITKSAEAKHYETNVAYTDVSAANPLNAHITGVAQSAGAVNDSTRIGDKVKISHVNIRMKLTNFKDRTAAINNVEQVIWRILVVQDKSYNISTTGAIPAGGAAQINLPQLLINDPNLGAASVMSQRNVDHFQTLVVLYDRCIPEQVLNICNHFLSINIKSKFLTREIQWSNGGNITNITNGLFLIVMNDGVPLAGESLPQVSWQSRMLFRDS